MKLSGYGPRKTGDGEISFPILECWNPMTNVATIAADVNGRRVLCRIAGSVLQQKFQAAANRLMEAVTANRPQIEAAAVKVITRKGIIDHDAIDIRLEDL